MEVTALNLMKLTGADQEEYFTLAGEVANHPERGIEFLRLRSKLLAKCSGLSEEDVNTMPLVEKEQLIKKIEEIIVPFKADFTKG